MREAGQGSVMKPAVKPVIGHRLPVCWRELPRRMAYTDKQGMTGSRLWSIIIVVIIHAIIGYAFVTGLAYNVVKKVAQDLKTFDVKDEPPPPEEKLPPPPPPDNMPPPPVVTPPPIVNVAPTMAPVIIATPTPQPVIHIVPPAPPPPPPPPIVSRLEPRGNPGSWTSNDDYPPAAIRASESGTTGFRLDIGPDGRVTQCTVTSSSGSSTLDSTTCSLLKRRAKFTPGRDSSGAASGGVYNSRIKWVLPSN